MGKIIKSGKKILKEGDACPECGSTVVLKAQDEDKIDAVFSFIDCFLSIFSKTSLKEQYECSNCGCIFEK